MTLIELLVTMPMVLVVAGATMALLIVGMRSQSRDQAYAEEVSSTQAALARLAHDLRQATSFQVLAPNAVQFQIVVNSVTYNVKYDCTAPDTLGAPFTRCARTQAKAPASPPAYTSKIGPDDIQHVTNGTITTFCNSSGTGPSGSVFFFSNPKIPNQDGSNLPCDEAYEYLIGPELHTPTYAQLFVKVPASGSLRKYGMNHLTVLTNGAFLANSDTGA